MASGRPLYLIKLEQGNDSKTKLVINEVALDSILNKVGSNRVAAISITGAPRSGKSYLLNFLLRYFSWKEDENEDWMGWGTPYVDLEGFAWGNGDDSVTFGIWVWSVPIFAKTSSGEKIAIILIDSQGTLNEFTTEDESITITSLCLLLSSVTIYNVKNGIEYENFELIRKSSILCQEILQGNYNFQDLLVIVRDWNKECDFDYNTKGGEKYLEDKLMIKPGLIDDAVIHREFINSTFRRLSCRLFPDPGDKVKSLAHKGHLAEVHPTFSATLEEFTNYFHIDGIHRKRSGEYKKFVMQCIDLLNEDYQLKSIAKEFIKQPHLNAFEMYKDIIANYAEEFYSVEDVRIAHEKARREASNYLEVENCEMPYKAMLEMQSQFAVAVQEYYERISKESEDKGKEFKKVVAIATNEVKGSYIDDIKIVFGRDTVSEKQIHLKHKILMQDGLANFMGLIPEKFRHLNFESQLEILEREVEETFEELKLQWESQKNVRLMSQLNLDRLSANEEYKMRIQESFGGQSLLQESVLQKNHEKIFKFILEKHCNFFEYGNVAEELNTLLREDLEAIYMEIKLTNGQKMIEVTRERLEETLRISSDKYKEELAKMEQEIQLADENFFCRNDQTKFEIKNQFITEVDAAEDIKSEFLNKLNAELEKQSNDATDKFNSAKQRYLTLIASKNKEIQTEILSSLEMHRDSNEIFTKARTKEICDGLTAQAISKYHSYKTENQIPSTMLDEALKETIEIIKEKIRCLDERGQEEIIEYVLKVNELVLECFELYKTKMGNLGNIHSEILLAKLHENSLKQCLQEMKNKCKVKDVIWVQPFLKLFEDKVLGYYEHDVKEAFKLEMESNLPMNSVNIETTRNVVGHMERKRRTVPIAFPQQTPGVQNPQGSYSRWPSSSWKDIEINLNYMPNLKRDQMAPQKLSTTILAIQFGMAEIRFGIHRNGNILLYKRNDKSEIPNYLYLSDEIYMGKIAEELYLAGKGGFKIEELLMGPTTKIHDVLVMGNRLRLDINLILSLLFSRIKTAAATEFKEDIYKCVISIPNTFDYVQRQMIKDAAILAGLEVEQILSESTAAAANFRFSPEFIRRCNSTHNNVLLVHCYKSETEIDNSSIFSVTQREIKMLSSSNHECPNNVFGRAIYVSSPNTTLQEVISKSKARPNYAMVIKSGQCTQNFCPNIVDVNRFCKNILTVQLNDAIIQGLILYTAQLASVSKFCVNEVLQYSICINQSNQIPLSNIQINTVLPFSREIAFNLQSLPIIISKIQGETVELGKYFIDARHKPFQYNQGRISFEFDHCGFLTIRGYLFTQSLIKEEVFVTQQTDNMTEHRKREIAETLKEIQNWEKNMVPKKNLRENLKREFERINNLVACHKFLSQSFRKILYTTLSRCQEVLKDNASNCELLQQHLEGLREAEETFLQ